MALIVGNDGTNTLQGGAGDDLVYGFDPNGPQGQVGSIAAARVASGLSQPLFAVSPPGDPARLFIVEKTGLIRILDLASGQVRATPFLDATAQISTTGEQGLLGLAFHPDYASNGLFYVQLTNPSGDNEIRRFQVSGDPNQANAGSNTPVLTIPLPHNAANHRAGWVGFGPDNFLYAAVGDGGSTPESAQAIDDLAGNILRLDINADAFPGDPARNYAIPAGNPYAGATAGADEIFAIGLRNPWRPSFDRALGDFYIADVGGGSWEEVNLGQVGANYGWPVREGPGPGPRPGDPLTGGTATAPIYFYSHEGGSRSITGGYVYRGSSEGLQGQYFFADFITSQIWTLRFDGNAWVATERTSQIVPDPGTTIGNPSSFGEDALGNLYIVDFTGGEVFRLTPSVASADQGDTLNGLGGDDLLFGGSGADTLNGGPGNDFLNGGPGIDSAVFSGLRSAYSLTDLGGGSIRVAGPDGTDMLTGIERLVFSAVTGPVNISAAGDFNGGATQDYAWRDASAFMTLWQYDATAQQVSTTELGAVGFSWSILASDHFSNASTDQMLVRSVPDGTMALLWVSGGQLAGANIGQVWNGIDYLATGQFTDSGGSGVANFLVSNVGNHELYDWWIDSSNHLQGINLGAVWSGKSLVGTGAFTPNGGTDFLVANAADHHLYDWWIDPTSHTLQGYDLGAAWSNVGYIASGAFTANGGGNDNFLVFNASDHHLYDWWIDPVSHTLQGVDLGAAWSNVQFLAAGDFHDNAPHDQFLVRNTVDNHLYVWWITAQHTLQGIDLGAQPGIELVDSRDFNDANGGNEEWLVRNTADGHFYEWWITSNQLMGADLGTPLFVV